MKRKYKALIFDVDGTLILNKKDGFPSKKVTETINKAAKIVHVGLATSRPYFMLSHIVSHLKLSGPSIINAGTQIIDANSKKVLWEKGIELKDVEKIHKIGQKMNISFVINDDGDDIKYSSRYIAKNPLYLWTHALTEKQADNFIDRCSHIPTVSFHKPPSWKKNKVDLLISHALATKQHAIFEIAKLLKIQTHEIIGVGDGYNDFPLLMACGLKVAMGNAVDDLKAIADYIAPSVEEEGLADVINKFIL